MIFAGFSYVEYLNTMHQLALPIALVMMGSALIYAACPVFLPKPGQAAERVAGLSRGLAEQPAGDYMVHVVASLVLIGVLFSGRNCRR